MTVTIFHNPACSTSRKALALLRERGVEPEVVEYLKTGWTRKQLRQLFTAAGLSAREALRSKAARDMAPELLEPGASDEAILAAMVAQPVLVERPFVSSPKGVRLCRPVERVEALL